ncbi:MAG: 50S ribosomal protein L15 [Candidatus Omnitrophica bacterium]|nr:50S ribosomal protein L15 [Candidatus Omnitrophota bacterium]
MLHLLKSPKGSRRRKFIKGRGPASGLGKTSGRGDNGQRSRSGRGIILGSEGGQMALIRRIPKVGFNVRSPRVYQVVQLDSLNKFDVNAVVDADSLKKAQLISSRRRAYKILSRGELKKALVVKAFAFSADAVEKIKKAGGTIEIIIPGKELENAQIQLNKKNAQIARKALNKANKAKKA